MNVLELLQKYRDQVARVQVLNVSLRAAGVELYTEKRMDAVLVAIDKQIEKFKKRGNSDDLDRLMAAIDDDRLGSFSVEQLAESSGDFVRALNEADRLRGLLIDKVAAE
jgi:hypothetical protein